MGTRGRFTYFVGSKYFPSLISLMSVIGFVYCAILVNITTLTVTILVNITTLTVMRGGLKLFSRKLSIVGFDWIAAAGVLVDTTTATSVRHIQRNSTDPISSSSFLH